eukprot:9476765-Pyramimonas_sp.AAC.1
MPYGADVWTTWYNYCAPRQASRSIISIGKVGPEGSTLAATCNSCLVLGGGMEHGAVTRWQWAAPGSDATRRCAIALPGLRPPEAAHWPKGYQRPTGGKNASLGIWRRIPPALWASVV